MNSGPPSITHSSGMPNVPNMCRKQSIRPFDPACACLMMGQFKYICQPQQGSSYPCSGKSQQICTGMDMLAGQEGWVGHLLGGCHAVAVMTVCPCVPFEWTVRSTVASLSFTSSVSYLHSGYGHLHVCSELCVFFAVTFLRSWVLSWRENNRKTKMAVKACCSISLLFVFFSTKGESCFGFFVMKSSRHRSEFVYFVRIF